MPPIIQQLIDAMNEELRAQHELAALLDHKIDAIRHHDLSRLESLTAGEQKLLDNVGASSRKRLTAVRLAGQQFLPSPTAVPTARQLAEKIPQPEQNKILALTVLLKEAALRVQSLNRINRIASQKILGHLDHIFRLIAQSGRDIGLYGRAGKKSFLELNRIFDAIA